MSSSLSLGLAIERLPATVLPVADPASVEGFDAKATLKNNINRVLSRFVDEGKWKGTVVIATVAAYEDAVGNKFITLPRTLKTCIRGGRSGYRVRGMHGFWYQFWPSGVGIRGEEQKYHGTLEDMGEGFCTFADITTASALTVTPSGTECSGSYLWIRGKDASGNVIYSEVDGNTVEGIRLDLADGTQTTTEVFSAVYSIEKAPTDKPVSVSVGSTVIGRYEPGERVANYRRYKVDANWTDVVGLFKRQHVWAEADGDMLIPDNLEAIKLGLMALQAEDQLDVERGEYYMGKALNLLNAELKEYNSGQENSLQIAPWLTSGMRNMT
jgi:hypothetical protein